MKYSKKPLALAVTLALSSTWQTAIAQSGPAPALPQIVISAQKSAAPDDAGAALAFLRAANSDTAKLLSNAPGVSLYGAGGVSSLPALHGMADDRIRIKVDGMDLISACANHMNPPLSYIDPSQVGAVKVMAGITPVSAGGDSIAGTILIDSAAPEFAPAGAANLLKGQAGVFYRGNGDARGANLSATLATEELSVRYAGSTAQAGNQSAARAFKPAAQSTGTAAFLAGDEIGSSRYKSENQALAVALRRDNHLLELRLGLQHIAYQGFPNQRMDMTGNHSEQLNLRYAGTYQWGTLETRIYKETTRHQMNFLEDKLTIGAKGMPMATEGNTSGALVKAELAVSERDIFRVGGEYQRYRLNDWWDPISSAPTGMMSPNTFWNIHGGQRDRLDVFGEWEARWNPRWLSQFGVRAGSVAMNTGTVQGYNNNPLGMMGMGYQDPANASTIPGAFNARDRNRRDNNLDLTWLMRYTANAEQSFEAGYARKTRSPNLYERFAWSSTNAMVMNMVNWFGDANGYVGNLDLKPELAHTLSASAAWHDAARQTWELNVTPYYTHVEHYIDARRCPVGSGVPCTTANRDASSGFVFLQFANQSARLYGVDISGHLPLANSAAFGAVTASGLLNYVNGKNNTTGDRLYNIMPLNARLALLQRLGNWSNTIEAQLVDAKTDVSQVRNELKTGGYGLLNLRASYQWKRVRLDIGVENALNKLYALPLGGAYVGQKPMSYGVPVPGLGRSLYSALNITF